MSGEALKGSNGTATESKLRDANQTVLYEICRLTLEGERIHSGKLVKNLKGRQILLKDGKQGTLDPNLIMRSLDYFQFDGDQSDLVGQKGRTLVRYGSLYRINDQRLIVAMELYRKYLRETGQPEPVLTDEMCKRGSERRAEYEEYMNIMRQLKG